MSFIDTIFVGKVIRDFGALSETNMGLGKLKVCLLLVERGGRRKLVFKQVAWGFLAASVSYFDLSLETIPTLQRWLGEAIKRARNIALLPFAGSAAGTQQPRVPNTGAQHGGSHGSTSHAPAATPAPAAAPATPAAPAAEAPKA